MSIQLVSIGLVLHQIVYMSSKGLAHFRDVNINFLRLGQNIVTKYLANLLLVLSAIGLVIYPDNLSVCILLFVALTAVITMFPRRISNHLALAWVIVLAIMLVRNDKELRWVLQCITCTLYFFVAFHKLNRDYFKASTSVGYGVVCHYLIQRFPNWTFFPHRAIYLISLLSHSLKIKRA